MLSKFLAIFRAEEKKQEIMNKVSESPWVHKGIYMVMNEKAVSKYCTDGIKFKVKNIRPILYICLAEEEKYAGGGFNVYLHRINSEDQFTTTNAAPEATLRVYGVYNNQVVVSESVSDFELLGPETDADKYFEFRYGCMHFYPIGNARKEMLAKWEKVAIERGVFTPSINPDYKSDKEKELASATDFFGQTVKKGDFVAYVLMGGYQHYSVGKVAKITDKSFVLKSSRYPSTYVCPHKFGIKCPEGFMEE